MERINDKPEFSDVLNSIPKLRTAIVSYLAETEDRLVLKEALSEGEQSMLSERRKTLRQLLTLLKGQDTAPQEVYDRFEHIVTKNETV